MNRFFLFGTLLAGLVGCYTGSAPPPILVGHVSDKTRLDRAGDQAELGIRLALAEWNKDNALADALGGRKILVHHTDTRGDLDAFESQAVRLVGVNRCVTLFGGLSAKEVERLDHAQVPLLTYYGGPVVGASNQVYYLGMAPSRQGEVLAKVAAENAKLNRIVILLDERRPESAPLVESFQKTWAAARKQADAKADAGMVLRFGKDAKWSAIVEQMPTPQTKAVLFAGSAQDFNAWHKEFGKKQSPDRPAILFAGDDGDHRLFDFDHDPKAVVLLATALPTDPGNAKVAAFMKAYQEAFQTEADVHSALAYDGFRLFGDALKRAQPQSTLERLREELQKTKDFDALTGPLTVTSDRQIERPLNVARWQNGKLTTVKTFPAAAETK